MSTILNTGTFRIVSLDGDRPAGIASDSPGIPYENVRLDFPIQDWRIERHGDVYRFRIDGFNYSGVVDGMVSASHRPEDDVEWSVYCTEPGVCTIGWAARQGFVWTVAPENSPNPHVVVEEFREGDPAQRFRFEATGE